MMTVLKETRSGETEVETYNDEAQIIMIDWDFVGDDHGYAMARREEVRDSALPWRVRLRITNLIDEIWDDNAYEGAEDDA
jgi:hypothetical protein